MDLKKRKLFLLLLGACGVILLLMANLLEFGSTHEVFLVAANFHNSSLSYLTSLNLNLGTFSKDNRGLQRSIARERLKSSVDSLMRNPDLNVTDVTLRYEKKHNKSNVHDDIIKHLDEKLGVVHKNSDKRSSKISKPHHLNKEFSTGIELNVKTRKHLSFRTNAESANPDVQDGLNRLTQSQSAFSHKHSKLSDTNAADKQKNSLDDLQPPQDISVPNRQTIHDVTTSDEIWNSNDTRDEVNADHIQEEVIIPESHDSNNEVPVQSRNISIQMNDETDEATGLDRKSLEASDQQRWNTVETAEPTDLFIEILRNSNNQNQERVDKIPSLSGQHNAGNKTQKVTGNKVNQHIQNEAGNEVYQHTQKVAGNALYQHSQKIAGNEVYQQTKEVSNSEQFGRQIDSFNAADDDVLVKEGFTVNSTCLTRMTGVEDILCMNRPQFSPDFRNPCWYQGESLRCLPYFHIIGVCKTGTTDLFERLSHHPQILKNNGILGKETWYWTWQRYGHGAFYRAYSSPKTLDEFIDQFDARAIQRYRKITPNGTLYHPAVTGHGDPMDFWDQSSWKQIPQNDPTADSPEVTAPSLIKHVNPKVKLILIFRDPVQRLFSNYLHAQFGTTAEQFHQDVLTSQSLLTSCTRNRSMKSCLYDENIIRSLTVPISGSFYSIHLREWLKVFPRKQIFIARTEDFSKNIADTLLKVFRFLRLDPLPTRDLYRIANMPHFYNTKAKETSGDIRNETEAVLRSMFEPYNNELAAILNDQKYNFNNI